MYQASEQDLAQEEDSRGSSADDEHETPYSPDSLLSSDSSPDESDLKTIMEQESPVGSLEMPDNHLLSVMRRKLLTHLTQNQPHVLIY